ncbi:hypothetical protein G6M89_07250 [Natronolimnobius sp. AArcel1]|uniref:hypothetical protein n=1 Tax=Natronolimnobius sp. AArcel1 TaxID=1679093 RepID=UPI0013EC416A|nr:hypothetical protein [Natronolimnobius sp. AArcel1]NGM68806.1 hypothetical protein [Natronolimnobius sp. AArcel1]
MRGTYRCDDCNAHFKATRRQCGVCGTCGLETDRNRCPSCDTSYDDSTTQRCQRCGSSDVKLIERA